MKLDTEKLNETVQPLNKLGKLAKWLFHFRQFYLFADGAGLIKLNTEMLNEVCQTLSHNKKKNFSDGKHREFYLALWPKRSTS